MTRKRLRYSELVESPVAEPVVAEPVVAEPVVAVPVVAVPAIAAPASEPSPTAPTDLARALVAAQSAEAPGMALSPVAAPVRPFRERMRLRTGAADVLRFRIADEWFGLELAVVEEAIDLPGVHFVPEMPPAMLGVITVRESLTPVYSPGAVLGLPLAIGASALIFRRGRGRVALVIDDVDDVATIDLSAVRDVPGLDAADGITLGVVRHEGALVAMLDAEALLAACQAIPSLESA